MECNCVQIFDRFDILAAYILGVGKIRTERPHYLRSKEHKMLCSGLCFPFSEMWEVLTRAFYTHNTK